ncbi:MAG: hypothetical protein II232_01745 [Spirochaetaceae bacterium]|nr:hypothetical protein [Spirochaetaceae bacterium]
MISSQTIENIYFSVQKGEISQKEAKNQLLTLIVKEPQFFGLEKLNNDDLQETICKIISKVESIFDNYDKRKNTKFSSYFQLVVRYIYQTWRKNKTNENIKYSIINNLNKFEFFERENENIYSPEKNIENLPSISDNNQNIKYYADKVHRKTQSLKLEFLIIALKSSHVITENQINQISRFTKISKTYLLDIIEKANQKLSKRKLQINHLEKMINRDYFKLEEIKMKINLLKYGEIEKNIFQEKYKAITNRRNKNLEKLKSIKLVPSDKIISDILKISPGKIRYYIKRNYKLYNISTKSKKIQI